MTFVFLKGYKNELTKIIGKNKCNLENSKCPYV